MHMQGDSQQLGRRAAGESLVGIGHVRAWRVRRYLVMSSLVWLLALGGCQSTGVHRPPDDALATGNQAPEYVLSDPLRDPYERFNRKMFNFNSWLDGHLLRPVAVIYQNRVPALARESVTNFFNNLDYPLVVMNQFLQGKFRLGFRDLARFGINSTFGLVGLFDVATDMGFMEHQEDFGQTLSVWGLPEGPFAVAPVIGPGTTLDFVNTATLIFVDAGNLISDPAVRYPVRISEVVSKRADVLGFERLQFGDAYIFQRDAYLQRRAFLVRDGKAAEDDDFLSEEDDFLRD